MKKVADIILLFFVLNFINNAKCENELFSSLRKTTIGDESLAWKRATDTRHPLRNTEATDLMTLTTTESLSNENITLTPFPSSSSLLTTSSPFTLMNTRPTKGSLFGENKTQEEEKNIITNDIMSTLGTSTTEGTTSTQETTSASTRGTTPTTQESITVTNVPIVVGAKPAVNLFCGYGSWASYRRNDGKLDIDELQKSSALNKCTHFIYAFAGLSSSGTVISYDSALELPSTSGSFSQLASIKEKYPHLKTFIAIGGWDQPSRKFSFLVSQEKSRAKMSRSMTEFAKLHGFDGVIVAWFFPGGHSGDKANYVAFLQVCKLIVYYNQ